MATAKRAKPKKKPLFSKKVRAHYAKKKRGESEATKRRRSPKKY